MERLLSDDLASALGQDMDIILPGKKKPKRPRKAEPTVEQIKEVQTINKKLQKKLDQIKVSSSNCSRDTTLMGIINR